MSDLSDFAFRRHDFSANWYAYSDVSVENE